MPLTQKQEAAVARVRKALEGKSRDVEHKGPAHKPHAIVGRAMVHAMPADVIDFCEAVGLDHPKAKDLHWGCRRALEHGAPEGAAFNASCLHELSDALAERQKGTPATLATTTPAIALPAAGPRPAAKD